MSNHSGGMLPMDVPILAVEFYEKHGYDRPLYTLSHDMLLVGPTGDFFKKIGFISANHENADDGAAVRWSRRGVSRRRLRRVPADAVGEQDRLRRPHRLRQGRAQCRASHRARRSAIGGQETQLYLTRGTWLAKRLGPIARLARTKIVPISFGFPFGLSLVIPPNIPLPTKIVMQVLPPIDIVAEFGEDPDIDEVDAHVRHVMQRALDGLAAERRLPMLG